MPSDRTVEHEPLKDVCHSSMYFPDDGKVCCQLLCDHREIHKATIDGHVFQWLLVPKRMDGPSYAEVIDRLEALEKKSESPPVI